MRGKPLSLSAAASIGALLLSALVIAAALEGIAPPLGSGSCSTGVVSRIYLGQATPAGAVTDAEWRAFVAESVASRFPAGFTELRADGRWRGDSGKVIEEQARIVEIAHADRPAARESVRAIAADYRRRFTQESVLVTRFRTVYCFEGDVED